MSPGAMIAVHAATAAAAQRKVLDTFRVNDATSPQRARSLAELGLTGDEPPLREFLVRGVIRGIDSRGRHAVIGDPTGRIAALYLDERAYIESRDVARKPTRQEVIMLVGLLAFAIGLAVSFIVR